jgi:hypothetical protein
MADKAIDSTTKILRKIQSDLLAFRREMNEFRLEVSERFDSIEEHLAGTAAIALEARGIAEKVKERVKRLEGRDA